jgi:ribosomal protein S18 acetylase RimI-like enzyme
MHGHKVLHTGNIVTSEAKEFFAEAVSKGLVAAEDRQFLVDVGATTTAFYAITAKGEVVGILAYRLQEQTAKVTVIYVEETSRRLGISDLLFDTLKGYLRRYGVAELLIDVPNTEETVLADLIEKKHNGFIASYRYIMDLSDGVNDDELLGQSG